MLVASYSYLSFVNPFNLLLLGNKSYNERMIYSKEYNGSNWTASYIASDFNSLKYFCGYILGNHKSFLLNILSNQIISDENFPDYGRWQTSQRKQFFFMIPCYESLNYMFHWSCMYVMCFTIFCLIIVFVQTVYEKEGFFS